VNYASGQTIQRGGKVARAYGQSAQHSVNDEDDPRKQAQASVYNEVGYDGKHRKSEEQPGDAQEGVYATRRNQVDVHGEAAHIHKDETCCEESPDEGVGYQPRRSDRKAAGDEHNQNRNEYGKVYYLRARQILSARC
jgi:hypothetical protein